MIQIPITITSMHSNAPEQFNVEYMTDIITKATNHYYLPDNPFLWVVHTPATK
jgi:hypothetical protein